MGDAGCTLCAKDDGISECPQHGAPGHRSLAWLMPFCRQSQWWKAFSGLLYLEATLGVLVVHMSFVVIVSLSANTSCGDHLCFFVHIVFGLRA